MNKIIAKIKDIYSLNKLISVWFVLGGWLGSVIIGIILWGVYQRYDSRSYSQVQDQSLTTWDGKLSDIALVKVGSEIIKMADLDFEHKLVTQVLVDDHQNLQSVYASTPTPFRGSSWHSLRMFLLQSLIKRKILYQMVKKDSNFDYNHPNIVNSCENKFKKYVSSDIEFFADLSNQQLLKAKICEGLVIDHYVKEHVINKVSVTEEQALKYYADNRWKFLTVKRIKLRHIHLADERTAKQVSYKVTTKNFSSMAKKHSIAPEAENGGLLPIIEINSAPVFLNKAFTMPVNKVSSIIKSPYGYHIILPLTIYPEKVQEFKTVKDQIIDELDIIHQQDLYQKWVLKALNSIEIRSQSYLLKGGQI